jgi:signal transduction histidine kinase
MPGAGGPWRLGVPVTFTFRRRLLLIVFATLVSWLLVWYTHNLVERLRRSSRVANETVAWFWAGIQYPLSFIAGREGLSVCIECGYSQPLDRFPEEAHFSSYCPQCRRMTRFVATSELNSEQRREVQQMARRLYSDLVNRLPYSIIFTDNRGFPQVVDGRPVDEGTPADSLAVFRRRIVELDRINEPVPISGPGGTELGYLHYGTDPIFREIAWMPFLELGFVILIGSLMVLFMRGERKHEREMSWVGFARETAHQISTPLSSLMGWLELMAENPSLESDPEASEALRAMKTDVERLQKITQRYAHIGRKPRMEPVDLAGVIWDTVTYFSERQGLVGGVTVEAGKLVEARVKGNAVLLGWVLENLIKNAVAACSTGEGPGRVEVVCDFPDESRTLVEIQVSDNGRGIQPKEHGLIFRPGFSTRKGGWGLGLPLAKRIVEEYHGGSLKLLSSIPGKGTTFTVVLPVCRPEKAC